MNKPVIIIYMGNTCLPQTRPRRVLLSYYSRISIRVLIHRDAYSNWGIIGSSSCLMPVQRPAITRSNAVRLVKRFLGTNFGGIKITIQDLVQANALDYLVCKIKWWTLCSDMNVSSITVIHLITKYDYRFHAISYLPPEKLRRAILDEVQGNYCKWYLR